MRQDVPYLYAGNTESPLWIVGHIPDPEEKSEGAKQRSIEGLHRPALHHQRVYVRGDTGVAFHSLPPEDMGHSLLVCEPFPGGFSIRVEFVEHNAVADRGHEAEG